MKVFGQKPTPSAWFGLVVMGIFLFVAVFTPWMAPYPESANVGGTWDEPSASHVAGRRPDRPRHAHPHHVRLAHDDRCGAGHHHAVLPDRHRAGLHQRGGRWLGRHLLHPPGRCDVVHPGPDLRADHPGRVRLQHSGADPHHRGAGLHPGVPAGAGAGHEPVGDGVCGGGAPARRGPVVGDQPRDPAQCLGAAGVRVRPALLLQLPVHRRPVLPRAWASSRPMPTWVAWCARTPPRSTSA